ncbi:MAG TPA: hypothetical protein DEB61_07730, partial [Alcanivorax sp.]|nr:hypothetical protein [Alcanivorax sp.]
MGWLPPDRAARDCGSLLASERERSSRQDSRALSNSRTIGVSGILPAGKPAFRGQGPLPQASSHSQVRKRRVERPRTVYDGPMWINDDVCYQALTARDARFDGQFFVAVVTTGV